MYRKKYSVEKKHLQNNTIHPAVAPTKKMTDHEWFLEKLLKLVFTKLRPIVSDRKKGD
jgi:hypothetical protein